ncbi:unnamed protein product [Dovyalis caffra]|uniref:Serine aminopeptidase S33 domain-containing protein n=1 Tax=Dovyalis caffra TaxID=77055 RepID=A0AAV1REX6_9ROSI|nr:unnamed protein product [Dovyalis caffra]
MAVIAGSFALPTVVRSCLPLSSSSGNFKLHPSPSQRRFAKTVRVMAGKQKNPYALELERNEMEEGWSRKGLEDYFEESNDFIKSDCGGGGPPRWFSPLDCGSRLDDSPLLLYLPGHLLTGIVEKGTVELLCKTYQYMKMVYIGGEASRDRRCLSQCGKNSRVTDLHATLAIGLVELVEQTVRSENYHSPNRPIYLVGESLGACLALAVAARNPDIELSLILSNPGTSFEKSHLQPLIPLLEIIPVQYQLVLSYILSSMTGDPLRMAMNKVVKGLPLEQAAEGLSKDVVAMSPYVSVLANILPKETLLWKLEMLKSASAFANSSLHAVKAQTLILTRMMGLSALFVVFSGRDQLLPSEEEGRRLRCVLPKCEIRWFNDNGHCLLLEDGVDLVTVIKATSFYRRGKYHDYVSDHIPPAPSEYKKICESNRLLMLATSPVMLSTLENGKIVKGLAGIPSEGPVLFIGNHMLLGCELMPISMKFLLERNILMRGMAHPMMFTRKKEGKLPGISSFDTFRIIGAVPVSGTNFFKLLSSKAHVLLYPGGLRESCHRKNSTLHAYHFQGEQYKLIWPEQSEFVRMTARFGAKIVPFGVVGEDDFGEGMDIGAMQGFKYVLIISNVKDPQARLLRK